MPVVTDFVQWRREARACLLAGRSPDEAEFVDPDATRDLFCTSAAEEIHDDIPTTLFRIPSAFLKLAETVGYHRDSNRWHLLYRLLWRLTHGEPKLLDIASDIDVCLLNAMEKSVRRDAHKMKAFIRFRRVETSDGEHFIAWHRPDHRVVRMTAPFFSRRFRAMNWTILTPDESVTWDQSELRYGPGAPASAAPRGDELEALWKEYYRAIFNPARIKLAMMRREMPVRHWPTLPETEIIAELLEEAPKRVELMVTRREGFRGSAAEFIPDDATWDELKVAAAECQGCDLYRCATQTVFGEGPLDARIVMIGEQPGDREDRTGRPFVGPAGKLLDDILREIGLDRKQVYMTNAVKHFKHEMRGKARLHKKPGVREVIACRPWLVAELKRIQPSIVVCLGATAAQSVIGRDFRIHRDRGQVLQCELSKQAIATYHPSAILRAPEESASQMRTALIADLRLAVSLAR